jgi:uncharacterized PurR-regulated membrane protein YhhQ (DUF165 family)
MSIFFYALSILVANVTATWFIPLGVLTVSVGTLVFGATFTLRDYVHSTYGRITTYKAIAFVVLLSILQTIFLDVPLRIIIASAVALLLSEVTDTEVYQKVIQRQWITRVVTSNAVSVPIDNIIFNLIAFLVVIDGIFMAQLGGDIVPISVLISIIVTGTFYKWGIGLMIALPRSIFKKD